MRNNSCFRIQDSVVIACIVLMMLGVVMPAWTGSAGRSRAAVCRNNLKLIGVGLELWKQNAGRYPPWDAPWMSGSQQLNPWPDILAMQNAWTPEGIEWHQSQIRNAFGLEPGDFIKTVDDDKIFMCPADHPHPHRINADRAHAWGFWRNADEDGYEYSYGINSPVVQSKYHARADQQVLSADGLWSFTINLSAAWVDDPDAGFASPSWYSNTVGYWHKGNAANSLMRDIHVETHKYPPDTSEIFFLEPGEDINAANY